MEPSKKMLRHVLQTLDLIAISLDTKGRLVFCNDHFLRLTGWNRDEALGQNWFDHFLPQDAREEVREKVFLQTLELASTPPHFENEIITRAGERRLVHWSNTVWTDQTGAVIGVTSIGEDITQRHLAEAALKASEEKYRELVENLNDVVYRVDAEGKIRYVSPSVRRVLGHHPDDVVGRSFEHLVHPEDANAIQLAFRDVLSGKIYPSTYRLRTRDGKYRWVRTSSLAIMEHGEMVGLQGVLTDVHDAKVAEESLRRKQEKYQTLFENMAQGVFYQGAEGRLIDVNPACLNMFGLTREQLLLRTPMAPEWVVVDEQGKPVAPDHHPSMVALQTGEPVKNVTLGVFNPQQSRLRWFKVNAIPQFEKGQADPYQAFVTLHDITELRDSQQELNDTLDATTDGIWTWNFKTNQLNFSSKYYSMLGYEPREFEPTFEVWLDLIHPEDRDHALSVASEYLKTKPDRYENQFRLRTKSGEYRWVRATARVVERDDTGEALRMIGNHEDVTHRVVAEHRIREQNAYLRSIFEDSSLAVFVVDVDDQRGFVFNFLSRAFERIFGLKVSDVVGRTPDQVTEVFSRETVEHMKRQYSVCVEEGRPLAYEERVDVGGREIWGFTTLTPVQNEMGKVTRIIGSSFDITDRKVAEQELLRQQRAISLNSRIAHAFLVAEAHPMYLQVLQAILETLDCPSGHIAYVDERGDLVCPGVVGEGFMHCPPEGNDVVHIARENWRGPWGVCLKEARSFLENQPLARPEEAPLPGRCALQNAMIVPIVHHDQVIGQLAVANRPTPFTEEDLRLLEGAASQTAPVLSALLEKERRQREHAQLEAQFRQAQKLESIGRLAGGVAHDFNNLLGAILMRTELTMDQLDPESSTFRQLNEIKKAARRSADLTRQLLAFARQQTVAPEVISLNEAVGSLLSMLRRLIGEDLSMVWKPAGGLWSVSMDPSQLDQILTNLCVNARDAIDATGEIILETANTTVGESCDLEILGLSPGDYVRLSVSDSGCGMDSNALEHIFEPFFTTKEAGKGTGLGLATVYGIVEQNGGKIRVSSELGQGTRFDIFLPRSTDETSAPEPTPVQPPMANGETLLFVEDDEVMLGPLAAVLESLGYHVIPANTPRDAIQISERLEQKIDLLLTDVVMPEMNGRDLANRLLEVRPDMKCLFMSGYTGDIIADRGKLLPDTAFIQKPFETMALAKKLREVLECSNQNG